MAIYCGIDWAAHHHDVAIVNDAGTVLATRFLDDDTVRALGGKDRCRSVERRTSCELLD